MKKYITSSLELHLFFARIMKEHSLFLEAGFTPKNKELAQEAELYKMQFEKLLNDVVGISQGYVNPNVLNSGEIVTPYTLNAEIKTTDLTGIPIDTTITQKEQGMIIQNNQTVRVDLINIVKNINQQALNLVTSLIKFKESLLNNVLLCKIFTTNYPLLIDHILREAKLYQSYIIAIENNTYDSSIKETELFWDTIMMEHALFIRGLLDPTENELINTANNFAFEYNELINQAKNMTEATFKSISNKTLQETIKYRDFKIAGTKGIEACQIKSIILPLLADHVLREANHYIRILNEL